MRTYRTACGTTGHRDFDDLVPGENVDTASREESLGSACTTEDLEENGNRGLVESGAVDLELERSEVEKNVKVEVNISGAWGGDTRSSGVSERVEVGLEHWSAVGGLGSGGIGDGGSGIAQDGGVNTSSEASSADIRVRANPVVVYGPVGTESERVPLAGEDLDAVDSDRHHVDTVNFEDGLSQGVSKRSCMPENRTYHSVSVNGEDVVGIARNRDQAEPIASVTGHSNDCERGSRACSKAPFSVDQNSIGSGNKASRGSGNVVPVSEGDHGSLVIDIVARAMRVVGIINNHGPTKTIAVLGH